MGQKPLAIISGGRGYVGSAIRVALENSGWTVVSLGRNATGDSTTLQCDVTNPRQVEEVIQKVTEQYGDISACIHAAAPAIVNKPLLEMDVASFENPLMVAVRGALLLAKESVPHMKAGAAFIGITSRLIEPDMALPPTGAYVTAKYGLRGFLRTLAAEVRAKGIRVYAVAPGFLSGGLNDGVPPVMIDFLASKSGAGTTTAEEVAALVLKLCTVPEAYPTGFSIAIPPVAATSL